MVHFLDFEKPVQELESKIEELRHLSNDDEMNIADEVTRLQTKAKRILRQTYQKLTPWQKTQVARHPDRPHMSDYVTQLLDDYMPLAGDRLFAEDAAIQAGIGRFRGYSVAVIGHEKGADTHSRVKHNFGMARPEGYRKAQRVMRMADRFGLPIITLVDTPGAYPGIGAEERGQAEAIARSTEICLAVQVPIISVIIGEGGSGGAIALATANRVLMLEHAVYSVISPEGCASILWRSGEQAADAAEALRLTADDLLKLEIIDEVLTEPLGGAHRNRREAVVDVGAAVERHLGELRRHEGAALRQQRRDKFLEMGKKGLG